MRDWSIPLATRVTYPAPPSPGAPPARPGAPTAPPAALAAAGPGAMPDSMPDDAAGVERCEVCGAAELWWRSCKLVCRNCRSIVKSCADL